MSEGRAALFERKLVSTFSDVTERAEARLLLAGIDHKEHGQDPRRVELALLKISGGSIEGLRAAVEQLNIDFRDVLVAAEYPNQGDHGFTRDPAIRAGLAREDRKQYARWLADDEEPSEEN